MPDSNRSSLLVSALFVLVPLITGIVFIVNGLREPLPPETGSWVQTPGVITGVSVFFDGPVGPEISGKRSHFEARVSYQYSVFGKTYAGEKGEFTLDRYSHEIIGRPEAERRAREKFPVGGQVSVFFDAKDPATSTLQPGFRSPGGADLAIGAACVLLAFWQIPPLLRRRKA